MGRREWPATEVAIMVGVEQVFFLHENA